MAMRRGKRPELPPELPIVQQDPWLAPYAEALAARLERYRAARRRIEVAAGDLLEFSRGYEYFGLNRSGPGAPPGVWYREWAPAARQLWLIGDFNSWDRSSHPLARDEQGVWSIFLPDEQYGHRLTHGSRVKVHVDSALGLRDRIPAWIRRAVADERSRDFAGQYWNPPGPYEWRHATPALPAALRIYEAHVGMATSEHRVGTYREFTRDVLPRIARGGYNAIQLMAIQEHPYYGSFGYHVSNFFAASSRFGTPEDLKELVDVAHGLGLRVLLDLVHSHAVKNINEGLNRFDGSEHQYFHAGGRGQHPAWDSLLFDYSKLEVQRFLLSNVRFWLEEYRLDGFRFDGVTSMIYLDHGLGRHFGSYDEYFPPHTDEDAITYLQLALEVAHAARPDATCIAEEVSGLAGLARPLEEGGVGFDYRLAMGIPDYWIKLLKEQRDEDWSMGGLYHALTNRRRGEKHVAYAESHDQALVGDKTIAFWLMDAEMYHHMNKGSQSLVIERGIALHKMIRLVTFALGGEAWLSFMGNEFGHPEWVDFPREGNNYSYHYARRQWRLVDDPLLRYRDLAEFDRAMQELDQQHGVLSAPDFEALHVHEDNKVLVARRGRLLFAFNFHPTRSLPGYRVGAPESQDYELLLNTDDFFFGGHGEVARRQRYPWQPVAWDNRPQSVQIYLPARTALVLMPVRS